MDRTVDVQRHAVVAMLERVPHRVRDFDGRDVRHGEMVGTRNEVKHVFLCYILIRVNLRIGLPGMNPGKFLFSDVLYFSVYLHPVL